MLGKHGFCVLLLYAAPVKTTALWEECSFKSMREPTLFLTKIITLTQPFMVGHILQCLIYLYLRNIVVSHFQ